MTTFKIFTIIIVISLLPLLINAQWIKTNGPLGGSVPILASSNSNILAGTNNNGVFFTSNNGQTWLPTEFSLGWVYTTALASSGSTVYTAVNPNLGIMRSTNSGLNWTNVFADVVITCIAANGNNVFAGSNYSIQTGLWRSTNSGQNWTQLLKDTSIFTVAINGSNIYAGSTDIKGLYLSTNNGDNWINIGKISGSQFSALLITGTTIIGGTSNNGVYLTTNNGQNWIQSSLTGVNISSFAINGSIIYTTAGNNGIYKSTNSGFNWTLINSTLNSSYIAVNANNLFCATNGYGIHISSDYGANWNITNFCNTRVFSITTNGNIIAAGLESNGGVTTTTNGGINWLPTPLTNNTIQAIEYNGLNLFAGALNGPYLSTNNGLNWSLTNLNEQITCMTQTGNYIFAGTIFRVFRTSNNGQSWIQSTPVSQLVNGLGTNGTHIFAGLAPGSGQGGIYVSSNYGLNWTQTNPNINAYDFAANGSNIFAAAYGVWLSTNNGYNWTQTSLTNVSTWCAATTGNNALIGSNSGIYVSTNNGVNWIQKNEGIEGYTIKSLTINNGFVYAGSDGQGVWKRAVTELISSQTPAPPVLYLPSNGLSVISTTPLLDWSDVATATSYRVQVASDTSFSNIKYDSNGFAASAITVPAGRLYNDSTYYWRVRANNTYGSSAWSAVWSFTPIAQIWFQMNSGVNASINDIYFPNAYTGIATSYGPSLILRSTNSGTTWSNTPYTVNGIYLYNVKFVSDNTGWITGNNPNAPYSNVILKTTDAGTNWTTQYQGTGRLRGISFINSNTGWIGGDQLYKTTNGGINWTASSPTGYIASYSLHFINESTGWMGSLTSTSTSVLKTTNGGSTWFSQLSGGYCQNIKFFDANTGFAATEGGFKKTTNGGQNWITSFSSQWGVVMSFLNAQTGWIVPQYSTDAISRRIFRTTNSGTTWTEQGFIFPSYIEGIYMYNYNLGWAVCSNGTIYRTSTGGVWVSNETESNKVPEKMMLYQNYPNPFNPVTTINFDLTRTSKVELVIYDITGKEIIKLIDEVISAGSYQTTWDAGEYPSGVYIYKIIIGDYVMAKKMVLLK